MKSQPLSGVPGQAKALMIQGTTSDAGKSALCAGICRLLRRQGLRVAPFKPQNMALNSAVTVDGGEIGRAQAAQAFACGIEPHTDMNPVLLKPNTDTGAQVIINGRAVADMDARTYHRFKPEAMKAVLAAYQRLARQYDVIVIEGAGSPAEINLRDQDIANMGFAEAIDCPVLLVADIDRGGVFAHLVGTLQLLSPSEQQRIAGFVINKFRGDVALLQPGNDWLHKHTGKPVLGVLPYLSNLYLEAEDGLAIRGNDSQTGTSQSDNERFRIAIPRLPRISNHTDFDPLTVLPGVELNFVRAGEPWPQADLVILPGSKSVGPDLEWLRAQGWEPAILRHLRYGGKLIGICGGLQMLGLAIDDSEGLEGAAKIYRGLGLMEYRTRLLPEKQLRRVRACLRLPGMPLATGYEIHAGVTEGPALERPLAQIEADTRAQETSTPDLGKAEMRLDGAISEDDQILATYLHGVFDQPEACQALLTWAGYDSNAAIPDYQQLREAGIERLADAVEQTLGVEQLLALLSSMPASRFAKGANADHT